MAKPKADLTPSQRAMMRTAIRKHARDLGYEEGMEEYEMKPRLRTFLRGVRKLPIWENPEDGYKVVLPPRSRSRDV